MNNKNEKIKKKLEERYKLDFSKSGRSPINYTFGYRTRYSSRYLPRTFRFKTRFRRATVSYPIIEQRIKNYFTKKRKLIRNKNRILAEQAVFKKLTKSFSKIKPISVSKAYRSMPQSSSPGFPFNGMIWKKSEAQKYVFKHLTKFDYTKKLPCLAGARAQLGKKARLVWQYPASVSTLEATFFYPLFDKLKQNKLFGYHVHPIKGKVALWDYNENSMGLDFPQFDANVLSEEIEIAFNMLKKFFRMSKQQLKNWHYVTDYFVNTPLVFRKKLYIKNRGVPSGSMFTQLIDSIVNAIRIEHLHLDYNTQEACEDIDVIVLGDDSIFRSKAWHRRLEKADLMKFFRMRYGTSCKIEFESDFHTPWMKFLGKWYHYADVKIDREKLWAQLRFPEKKEKRPEDLVIRIVNLMWSCGNDDTAISILGMIIDYLKLAYPKLDCSGRMKSLKINKYKNEIQKEFPTCESFQFVYTYQILDAYNGC